MYFPTLLGISDISSFLKCSYEMCRQKNCLVLKLLTQPSTGQQKGALILNTESLKIVESKHFLLMR